MDWDDPSAWSADDALTTLDTLCLTGSAEVPVYDLSRDGRVVRRVTLGGSSYVVAEGLFGQDVVAGARERGLPPTRSACATTGWSPSGDG